jgi:hypothetical protein
MHVLRVASDESSAAAARMDVPILTDCLTTSALSKSQQRKRILEVKRTPSKAVVHLDSFVLPVLTTGNSSKQRVQPVLARPVAPERRKVTVPSTLLDASAPIVQNKGREHKKKPTPLKKVVD